MAFHPFDVSPVHLAYTILGAFTVIFGLCSLIIKEKLYLGEAPIATVVGIILGPHVLGLFDPLGWGNGNEEVTDIITLEVTRVVIALSVLATGIELPKAYMKRHWRSLFFLLGPCMVYGWLVSGLLVWAMIPGLNYLSSLVISACLSPTDPILAQAVVGGKFADKHVPAHIRHVLSAESGSNDGAAFPFLYIALYLTLDRSAAHAVGEWFYMTWAYEVLLGTIIGSLLGWSVSKCMKIAERKKLIDRQSYVAQYVSLAILSIGICTLLGSDDLLAAFACGCAFAWDGFFNKATEDAVFSNVIDLLFNCAAFIYIGAIIPFKDFNNHEIHLSVWRLVVLAILILLLRRLPVILALYRWIPDIKTFREAAFVGWFGPMGVGAIFISTLARHHIPAPTMDGDTSQVDLLQETIVPIVCMLVLSSVLTHGLSIPFFLTGRRVHSITYTWSRQPSLDGGRGEPAWVTHTRRHDIGEDVDLRGDHEEGDIGLAQRHTRPELAVQREKSIAFEDSNGGSSSSDTRGGDVDEKRARDEEKAAADGREIIPPLARYREGDDLVIERRISSSGEVNVDIVKDHYKNVPEGSESPAGCNDELPPSAVRSSPPSQHSTNASSQHSTNRDSDDDHSTNAGSDDDDIGDGFVRRPVPYASTRSHQPTESPPRSRSPEQGGRVHSYIPAGRLQANQKKKKEPGWRRFLRVGTGSSSSASAAEEGRLSPEHHGFREPRSPVVTALGGRALTLTTTMGRGDSDEEAEDDGRSARRDLRLSRTISFAPDAAMSSTTAPSMANYGSSHPNFQRNSSLQMFRTTSIRSTGEDDGNGVPSISFASEPRKER